MTFLVLPFPSLLQGKACSLPRHYPMEQLVLNPIKAELSDIKNGGGGNETRSWFLEAINSIDTLLTRVTRKRGGKTQAPALQVGADLTTLATGDGRRRDHMKRGLMGF